MMNDSENSRSFEEKTETTDEYLRRVTVGKRKPLYRSIYLAPYDPDWPSQFSLIANQIREALLDKVLQLEHVGSTAVPGLSAKPKIDIVLAVSNSADEQAYVPQLEEIGYELRIREPDWFEHRLLRPADIPANIHVFSVGCEEIDRMLAFRDWLRTHDDDRQLYEETKRELAAQTWKYTQNYADAKTEIIQGILARALGSTGNPDAA